MSRIVLVTFDLDNTLWDVDSVIRNAERVTRAWFDEEVPEVNRCFAAEDFARMRREAVAEDETLAHDVSRLRREVFRRAIAGTGRQEAEASRLAQRAFDVFLHERHRVELYDDSLGALEALAGRVRLGALTNGNADVARIGLGRFFEFAFSAAAVGASKPHPAMFRAALARAGAEPDATVHVGDHPVDDIHGAAALGIHTIWVNRKAIAYPEDAPPTRETRSLADVPRIIEEIGARRA
jgi:putative hydrolase of the HAD superfamily